MSIRQILRSYRKVKSIRINLFSPFVEEDDVPLGFTYFLYIRKDDTSLNTIRVDMTNDENELLQSFVFEFQPYDSIASSRCVEKMISYIIDMMEMTIQPERLLITYTLEKDDKIVTKQCDYETYSKYLNQYRNRLLITRATVEEEYDTSIVEDHISDIDSLSHSLRYYRWLEFNLMLCGLINYTIDESTKEMIKEKECPVLLEPLELGKIMILNCKHMVSKEAFNQIVKNDMHPKCPVCRHVSCPSDCTSC